MNYLKNDGFQVVVIIYKDCLKGVDKYLFLEKELKKKGRGFFDFVVEVNLGVIVICWFDNGLV